jgi:capsule polysaccharide modification protein KpsS
MVIIVTNYGNHLQDWLGNFQKFLKANGHEPVNLIGCKDRNEEFYKGVIVKPDCKHVFMWNGEEHNHPIIKKICNENGITYSVLEVGFFPQKEFYIIDKKGINANSSIMTQKISVTPEDIAFYEEFRLKYLAGRTWKQTNKYILVPMQLPSDTNVMLHSPIKSMQDFINHVEEKFRDKKIIFKRHPLDGREYKVSPRNEYITGGNILDVAQDAEMVYGINSTSLLETSMLGVPTVSIGNGFLKVHADHVHDLLVYLCKRQIPVGEINLTKWFSMTFPEFPNNFSHEKSL